MPTPTAKPTHTPIPTHTPLPTHTATDTATATPIITHTPTPHQTVMAIQYPDINVLPGPGQIPIVNEIWLFTCGAMCLIILAAAAGTFLGRFFRTLLRI